MLGTDSAFAAEELAAEEAEGMDAPAAAALALPFSAEAGNGGTFEPSTT